MEFGIKRSGVGKKHRYVEGIDVCENITAIIIIE